MTRQTLGRMLGAFVLGCGFVVASADTARSPVSSGATFDRFAARTPATAPGQTATLLPDGRWLFVGGTQQARVSGEVTTSPAAAQSTTLIYPRYNHTTTLLPDGSVAVMGGVGADGKLVAATEIIDLSTGQTRVVADSGPTPRAGHTATLLTDGLVLIEGGVGSNGQLLSSAELWDPEASQGQSLPSGLDVARSQAHAALLPTGDVLVWGGRDASGKAAAGGELYDVQQKTFSAIAADDPRLYGPRSAPAVAAFLPAADTADVPVGARIALRLSTPLRATESLDQQISLVGPSGAVSGKVVAAEGGELIFFTPSADLLPQATYTIFLQGAKNQAGLSFPFSTSTFTTQGFEAAQSSQLSSQPTTAGGHHSSAPTSALAAASTAAERISAARKTTTESAKKPEPQDDDDSAAEDWLPSDRNRHGDWHVLGLSGDPIFKTVSTGKLSAPAGQTSVTGRVLRYHGKPLAGVTVSVAGRSAVTDSSGQFLISQLTPGVVQLKVDGTSIAMHGRHYTKHFIRVELEAGKTTSIANPIFLPRVDPATEVTISSPASKEIVLTHPAIPGLEVHIPKGVVLREYDGKIVTKLSITPIPLDRPPYPTPRFAVYFTLQPGGAFVDADASKAIRVIYPNYQGLAPGSRADFWNYDPEMGWQVYGQGTVSANGKQVIPDPNVGFRQIISFGMGLGAVPAAPPKGPPVNGCVQGGDPVDCATGLFLHTETDLAVSDVVPISVTRTYRQNDSVSRAFGIGTNLSYNMWLYTASTASVPPQVDLVLADGGRVAYFLTSGTSLSNAVWTHNDSPSGFYGSVLTSFNNSSGEGFMITMRDQTVLRFGTHSPNGILSITDINGNAITFTTTNASNGGNITRVTSPSGRYIQFSYDSAGRITDAVDNIGRRASYFYDASGRLATVKDLNGKNESFGYDGFRMTTVTDKRGNTMVTNQYDGNGRVAQQTLADGAIWRFSYLLDGNGNVTQTTTTDPRGIVRQDSFNASGYLTQQIRAYGLPEQQITTFQRDANNQLLSVTDALGRTTQFAHDGFGNVTSVTQLVGTADAVTASFAYDPTYQHLTSYTDPLGHATRLGLDWRGNLTSISDPLSHTVQVVNDSFSRPVTITNALGKVTQLNYNLGDLASVTDPLGRSVSVFTDTVGRVTGTTDALAHNTQYGYDSMDRMLQVTDARGGVTAFTYDNNGNLLTVRDPRNLANHTYTYDSRNRIHTYTDPLGATETYGFDGMGNLTSKIDRENQTTSYTYDGLNRLKTVTYADGSSITITWDKGNRPTQFVDTVNGTITRQYDGLDRLTEEVSPQGQVDYLYDAAGRRTQLTVSGFPAITYHYDDANRLTQIAQGTTVVGLSYDAANRRSTVTLPNGIVGTYSYDDADQLVGLSYDRGATHVGDFAYTYDQAGRRITQSDSLSRLGIPATIASATYDAANRLTNWGGTSLGYDGNGNLTTSGGSTYSWNARDQLGTTSDGGGSFSYDAFGRRTAQTVNGATVPYLYDGANAATVSGSLILNGFGLDDRFAQVGSSGTTSFLIDSLGSTAALTDNSGSVSSDFAYTPYGTTTASGAANTPFQYTGRENDGATGLYYYRTRYYSPMLNRFIGEDPSGFAAGGNWYAYVGGNPVSFTDPSGLVRWGDVFNSGAGVIGAGLGIGLGGALMVAPTGISQVVGGVVLAKSAYSWGSSWYNLVRAFSDDKSLDIPDGYQSLPRAIASQFSCSKNAQLAADAAELGIDFVSGRVTAGFARNPSGFLKSPVGYPMMNSNQFTHAANYAELSGEVLDTMSDIMQGIQSVQYAWGAFH